MTKIIFHLSFSLQLPLAPSPNTILNILCEVVLTAKATLIGKGMGEASLK